MLLRELFDTIIVESGHFIVSNDIEIDIDKFKILVEKCLGIYNQFCPHDEKFNLNISNLSFEFKEDTHQLGIPDWLSDAVPVRLAGVHPWYFRQKEEWVNRELEYKKQFPWVYNKPVLYVPVQSIYEIHGVWNHKITTIPGSKKEEKQYELKTIDYGEDEFIDLVQAKFLKSVGRNRRMFTLNDLPITIDASDLVSEGDVLEKEVMDDLQNKQNKFYLAWR